MESSFAPLSEACAKTLWDKTYEKRKVAAAEIEKYCLHCVIPFKWLWWSIKIDNFHQSALLQNGNGIQFDQKLHADS